MGLKVLNCPQLSTIAHDCRHFATKAPLGKGSKKATKQKCALDDCAQIAESGPKPPFESPHLDFPEKGPDCVADPLGNVPCRCFDFAEKEEKDKSGKSLRKSRKSRKNSGKSQHGQKRDQSGRTSPNREAPPPKLCSARLQESDGKSSDIPQEYLGQNSLKIYLCNQRLSIFEVMF